MKFKGSGGVELSFLKEGNGSKRIVFIHGLCGCKEFWLEQIKFFSKTSEVIAIDLLGHGQSSMVPGRDALATTASVLSEFLDSLPPTPTTLVGHSLGGFVANEMLNMTPKVSGCIFIDSPCLYLAENLKEYRDWGLKIAQSEEPALLITKWFSGFLSDTCKPEIKEQVVGEALKFPPQWIAELMANTSPPSPTKWTGAVLVIEGEQFFPQGNSLSWMNHFPKAIFNFYSESSHYNFLENPRAVNAVIKEFLDSI